MNKKSVKNSLKDEKNTILKAACGWYDRHIKTRGKNL